MDLPRIRVEKLHLAVRDDNYSPAIGVEERLVDPSRARKGEPHRACAAGDGHRAPAVGVGRRFGEDAAWLNQDEMRFPGF
jgi:hypothetical protein